MATRLSVVCGATGELGRAVVAELVAAGDRVVAVGRRVEVLRGMVDAHGEAVEPETADLANPDDVGSLWERIRERGEPPSAVVNTVGGYRGGALVDTSPEDYRFLVDLNLTSTWLSCGHAAQAMRDRGGSIVNVAARPAIEGGAGSAAYAVAKAAVVRLTQVLAAESKDHGVRANVIVPAILETEANRGSYPEKIMQKAVPPEAIARVITWLCGDDAWPITGAVVPVPGRY